MLKILRPNGWVRQAFRTPVSNGVPATGVYTPCRPVSSRGITAFVPDSRLPAFNKDYVLPATAIFLKEPKTDRTAVHRMYMKCGNPLSPISCSAARFVPAMLAWSVKTRCAPSRHFRDARVYGHTTTFMHDMSTPHPPTVVWDGNAKLKTTAGNSADYGC